MRWATLDGNDHALYLTDKLFNQTVQLAMTTDRLSSTFAALADPTRRAILARLALGETSVSELAEPFEMSMPAVSKHLKVLERAGLIARGREAQMAALPDRADRAQGRGRLARGAIAGSGKQRLDRLERLSARSASAKEKKRREAWPQKIASTLKRDPRVDRRHARVRCAARAGVFGVDRSQASGAMVGSERLHHHDQPSISARAASGAS